LKKKEKLDQSTIENETKKEKKIKDSIEELKIDNFTSDIRHYNFAAAKPVPQLTPGGLD